MQTADNSTIGFSLWRLFNENSLVFFINVSVFRILSTIHKNDKNNNNH